MTVPLDRKVLGESAARVAVPTAGACHLDVRMIERALEGCRRCCPSRMWATWSLAPAAISAKPLDFGGSRAGARQIQPQIDILRVSCTTGDGLSAWMSWLASKRGAAVGCSNCLTRSVRASGEKGFSNTG